MKSVALDRYGSADVLEVKDIPEPTPGNGVHISCFGQPENLWLGPMAKLLRMTLLQPFVSQRLVTWVTKESASDLEFLRKLLEEGAIVPVIDEVFPLTEIREAMRKLGTGHARGKIVIAI
ncbi:MAG: zinc-binding dehydrogenase [Myxococcota bacterium]|jgi:NADPH:quinone reductase-like Zn-dependent oxidoreductase|nr:zinc-binding dehydrogenase [Myxococcota bacterium]